MKIQKDRGITLIGSGELLQETCFFVRSLEIKVAIIIAPRHYNEENISKLKVSGAKIIVCKKEELQNLQSTLRSTYDGLCLCFGPAWIFPKNFIEIFAGQIYNYNGIPIPQYLGGAHYSWQVLNKNRLGACIIQQITTKIDRGPIARSLRYYIEDTNPAPLDYEKKNFEIALPLIKSFLIEKIEEKEEKQEKEIIDWNNLLYFPRLSTDLNGWINWGWSGEHIMNFCMAFDKPYGGAKTTINGVKVALIEAEFEKDEDIPPFCSGLIVAKDPTSYQRVKIAVSSGFINATIKFNDKGREKEIRLGDRFMTSHETLERAMRVVKYNENGLYITETAENQSN